MDREFVDIGLRLRKIRKENNRTQEYISEKCKITVEYYRRLESGDALPNIKSVEAMAKEGWDIDYILTGKRTKESVFKQVLATCTESEKFDICGILIYKMIGMLQMNTQKLENIPKEKVLIAENRHLITIEDRVREAILDEVGRLQCSRGDMANILSVSLRTIDRLLNGETEIKISMVLSLYEKYGYSPAYIILGEINSNSKCDYYYRKLTEAQQEDIMKFAKNIVIIWMSLKS